MIGFGLVVAINNLLALKNYSVFLTNFNLHQSPTFLHKWFIRQYKAWIQRQALREFEDVKKEVLNYAVNLGINDCSTAMFTVLYLADQQNKASEKHKIKSGNELFAVMAQTELDFEIMKKQKQEIKHE